MRVDEFEHRRPAGTMNCPDCNSTIRGYEEMLYSTSLTEFLKDGNR